MTEKHWEAKPTAYRIPREYGDVLSLTYCPNPGGTKHENGTTSYSLRFPALIVTDCVADREKVAEKLADELNLMVALKKPRPIEEYHEDMGDVMWWCWEEIPAQEGVPGTEGRGRWKGEPPYVGSPLDLGFSVYVDVTLSRQYDGEVEADNNDLPPKRYTVGGWPGYHTHFTPLPPMPNAPTVTNGDGANG